MFCTWVSSHHIKYVQYVPLQQDLAEHNSAESVVIIKCVLSAGVLGWAVLMLHRTRVTNPQSVCLVLVFRNQLTLSLMKMCCHWICNPFSCFFYFVGWGCVSRASVKATQRRPSWLATGLETSYNPPVIHSQTLMEHKSRILQDHEGDSSLSLRFCISFFIRLECLSPCPWAEQLHANRSRFSFSHPTAPPALTALSGQAAGAGETVEQKRMKWHLSNHLKGLNLWAWIL